MDILPPELIYIIYKYKYRLEERDVRKLVHKEFYLRKHIDIIKKFSSSVIIGPSELLGFSRIYNALRPLPCYCNLCGEFKKLYYKDYTLEVVIPLKVKFCDCVYGMRDDFLYGYNVSRIKEFYPSPFSPFPVDKIR